jgi:probable O-glycosylation ligase (exosortase A-associated)
VRDVIFALLFYPCLPICFFRPFFGILLWTLTSYLSPERFAFGFAHFLPVGYMIAIPTIAGMFFSKEFRLPPFTRETLLIGFLWAWFACTTLNVYSSTLLTHHLPDTIARFEDVSKSLLMMLLAVIIIRSEDRFRWWYIVTAASFAFLGMKALRFGVVTAGEVRVYGPPNTELADNNAFGLALNMSLPMFLCLAANEPSRKVRVALYIAFVAALGGVFLSYSRGAMVGLVFVLITIAIQSRHRIRALLGIFVLGAVLLAIAPTGWINRMSSIKTASKEDASAQQRFHSWEFARRLAYEFPILGGGFQTFTDPMFERYGLSVLVEGTQLGPHSIYFQMLAEHGFPGLFLFLTLIASCIWSAYRVKRAFRRVDPDHWLVMYANMIIGSLIGYAASGAFLGLAYFGLFYQLVGTTIILKSLAYKEFEEFAASESTSDVRPELSSDSALA